VYHLCGPVPFMQGIRNALIKGGVSPCDIQYEVFGPDLWQADYNCDLAARWAACARG
jgi:nitric oxide dioxygenase